MMLTLFALLLVITTTYSDGAGAALACDKTAAEIKAITDATVATLRNKNLRVVEGEMKVFETKAFGANVGNPYVVYFHPAPSPIPSPSASLPAFRLGKKTAVLFVGCTPASAAYFSFRSYALNRGKDLVFASLGDSLNNLVINTTGTSTSTGRKGAGSAAGSTAAVVTTADAGTYQLVKDALEISVSHCFVSALCSICSLSLSLSLSPGVLRRTHRTHSLLLALFFAGVAPDRNQP